MITIPANTLLSISRHPNRIWIPHTTRREITARVIGGSGGAVVAEADGWLVLTRWEQVKRLKAEPTQQLRRVEKRFF